MTYLKVWVSLKDALEPFSDAEKGRLFDAMLTYADSGEEPHFTGNERFIWAMVRQNIDMTRSESEKNRRNVKNRWSEESDSVRQDTTGYENVREDTTEYETVRPDTEENEPIQPDTLKKSKIKKSNVKKGNNLQSRVVFVPPTVDEVKAYCDERGSYWIDPQYFVDYYEARGWMLTKNRKMVDWKAAVRTWEKNERERDAREHPVDLPF